MMGRLDDRQKPFFYDFCLDDHVPQDHLLRHFRTNGEAASGALRKAA
jgi:hypothetical protein